MVNKNFGPKLVLVLMVLAVVFTACKSMPNTIGGMKIEPGKELATWKGEWVSLDSAKNDPSLNPAYKEAAAKMENYTVEGFKLAVEGMYKTSFSKIKFDGTNTVVFTVKDADGKEKEISSEYVYKGKVPVIGYDGYYWETFEAVKNVRGLTMAKYIICFPPH